MAEKHVVFLEEPQVGKRVKITYNGQTGYSFPVITIDQHPTYPGTIRVYTNGGASLIGSVVTNNEAGVAAPLPVAPMENADLITYIASPSKTLEEYEEKKNAFEDLQKVRGHHYTDHVDHALDLADEGKVNKATELLLEILDRVEFVSTIPMPQTPSWSDIIPGSTNKEEHREPFYEPIPPWYYERLAIIYRKQKQFDQEIAVLNRYLSQPRRVKKRDEEFRARIAKAQALLTGHVNSGIVPTVSAHPPANVSLIDVSQYIPPPGPFDHVGHILFICEHIEDFASLPWSITLEFGKSSSSAFGYVVAQAKGYPTYKESLNSEGDPIHAVTFGPAEVPKFEELYKLVKSWKSIAARVCDRPVTLHDVNKWLRCYRDKLVCHQSNPLFCYGASPFTFNIFGCHRTMIREDWFRYGQMGSDGSFAIDKRFIAAKIAENLLPYRICPALNPELIRLGFSMIPDVIHPKRDPEWTYEMLSDGVTAVGVHPRMAEMATGFLNIYTPTLVTPQFERLYSDLEKAIGIQGQHRTVFRCT